MRIGPPGRLTRLERLRICEYLYMAERSLASGILRSKGCFPPIRVGPRGWEPLTSQLLLVGFHVEDPAIVQDRVGLECVVCGPTQAFSGGDVELAPVSGTRDNRTFEGSSG